MKLDGSFQRFSVEFQTNFYITENQLIVKMKMIRKNSMINILSHFHFSQFFYSS